jgi:hypothetical protein
MKNVYLSLTAALSLVLVACTSTGPTVPSTIRVRKDVKNLTAQEKADFVGAVKKLKATTSPFDPAITYYDQFVKWHYLAFRCDYESLNNDPIWGSLCKDKRNTPKSILDESAMDFEYDALP